MTEGPSRRDLMTLTAAVPAAAGAIADPTETLRLWPGQPPGWRGGLPPFRVTDRVKTSGFQDRYWDQVGEPALTVFRPARPNGAAALIMPGGGYVRAVIDKEAFESGRRLAEAGITGFVLRYRLPAEGWDARADVPLQDAQRAMRLIRHGARGFGIDPARVAAIGFSAGGHLSASLATRHAAAVYAPVDAADALSARPDLSGLLYPVVQMGGPFAHGGSRDALLGPSPSAADAELRSPDRQVSGTVPPTFLVHALDDPAVPPQNSLAYFAALRAARVRAEMHLFEEGGHGFGIMLARGKPAAGWPELFLAFAARQGLIRSV